MNTYYDDFDLDIQKVTYDDINTDIPCGGPDSNGGGGPGGSANCQQQTLVGCPYSPGCNISADCPTLGGNNCGLTRTISLCVCR